MHICKELTQLYEILCTSISHSEELTQLINRLRTINKKMWDNEAAQRSKEASQTFDKEFIQLGRNVYYINDERVAIKHKINELFGSHIIEEKSYTNYQSKNI